MNNNFNKRFPLILGLLLIGVGMMLFAFPLLSSGLITIIACISLFFYGMTNIIRYFASEKVKNKNESYLDLMIGIITVGLSIMFLFTPAARLALLGLVVAVWLFLTGLRHVVKGIPLKNSSNPKWVGNFISGGICIIFGVFMILNPLHGIIAIDNIIALAFFIQGFSIIISSILNKNLRTTL